MAKKQNRYARLNAKRVVTTKSGSTISLASIQIDTDHEISLGYRIDGELGEKKFPRPAEGWRDALELPRGDAQLMENVSSIESA